MSFFCPHFEMEGDRCAKLKVECVPGRPGCVLRGKVEFLVPAEDRLRARPGRKSARGAKGGAKPG